MIAALVLLAIHGVVGAFDTIYYHEWRARLPALGRRASKELLLHAVRDALYFIIFVGLALFAWHGGWAAVLLVTLVLEIVITLWDFVVEIAVRKPLGDVYAGERVTHAILGILFGAMLVLLLPVLLEWWRMPAELAAADGAIPDALRGLLFAMGVGALLSGVRDLLAALEVPGASWPWGRHMSIRE